MVLALHPGPVYQGLAVRGQAGEGAGQVGVDLDDLLDGGGLHERAGDPLLDRQDDALGGLDPDGSGAQLDGLEGVLYLEEAALRGIGHGEESGVNGW